MPKILMRVGFERRNWKMKFLAALTYTVLTLGLPCHAQYASSSIDRKTSPRALGVLQQLPNGNTRLFPVSIFLNGQFYDARFYLAKPVPLSLYDETEYVALSDGMPVGKFIVHTAQQIPDSATWWGVGDWKPDTASTDNSKPAKAESKDDGRPVLKKPGSDDKKTDTASSKSDGTFKPDDNTDRPVLRKPKEGKPQPQVTATTGEKAHVDGSQADPNRPVLQRKQPVQKNDPLQLIAPKRIEKGAKYLVAISDPEAMNNRPFDYVWSADEKAKWTGQLTKMAMDALRKYAETQTRAPLVQNAKFAETHIATFDLDYSNQPYLIFTGRVDPTMEPPPASRKGAISKAQESATQQLATFYVTVVARLNSQDQLTQLLATPTDSLHLDLTPRLDLIDAVDADGDNRAELLFRKTTDSGGSYVLYRMTPFQMSQVFEGGSGN